MVEVNQKLLNELDRISPDDFREHLEKYTVMLSWTPSLNTAKDLVDQLLYMSMDRGKNYDTGKSLGSTVSKTEVANLDAGKEYTFKVTTKDAAGNEKTQTIEYTGYDVFGNALGQNISTFTTGRDGTVYEEVRYITNTYTGTDQLNGDVTTNDRDMVRAIIAFCTWSRFSATS